MLCYFSRPVQPGEACFPLAGKKQFNQLMGLLDKGTTKEALGGRSGDGPLRAVRAKREADEAGD